jgi:valyl-tRNA synthetase
VGPGNDIRFSHDKVLANRNFANKIWNAARFIRMHIENEVIEDNLPKNLMLEDKWIISLFNTLVKDVTENLEKFELGLAIAKLYDFIWDKFCDWYIEFAKIRLNTGTSAKEAKCILVLVMKNILKLLHPFMPFITEEIYTSLPHKEEALTISRYPEFSKELYYEKDQEKIEKIIKTIRAIRNRRAELNVVPSKKTKIYIATDSINDFEDCKAFFIKLAYGTEVFIDKDFDIPETLTIISTNAKVYIPLGELVDRQAERQRLQKQLEKCEIQLMQAENKLKNDEFLAKAPKHVIEKISNNKNTLRLQITKLKSEIDSFL